MDIAKFFGKVTEPIEKFKRLIDRLSMIEHYLLLGISLHSMIYNGEDKKDDIKYQLDWIASNLENWKP